MTREMQRLKLAVGVALQRIGNQLNSGITTSEGAAVDTAVAKIQNL